MVTYKFTITLDKFKFKKFRAEFDLEDFTLFQDFSNNRNLTN